MAFTPTHTILEQPVVFFSMIDDETFKAVAALTTLLFLCFDATL